MPTTVSSLQRLVLVVLPAAALATVVAAALVEVWVRTQWDDRRGTPGFYVRDAVLGQRLNAGYEGWFAGVPVRINALGSRDAREYTLFKAPNTFRILVLGDSVTFGHGALFETTYPYLVEQRLKAWRRDVNWEVWNLGVPGYNTADELAYLQEVKSRFQPDLVVVGGFPNDITFAMPTEVVCQTADRGVHLRMTTPCRPSWGTTRPSPARPAHFFTIGPRRCPTPEAMRWAMPIASRPTC